MRPFGALVAIVAATMPAGASAQLSHTFEQTYLAARHNWVFRARYPEADRLFNAFDYGHAVLSETLLSHQNDQAGELEHRQFSFIVNHLLRHPPAVPLEERAIAPTFARLVPEVDAMFTWAHALHRQIYDIWADEHIGESAKDAAVAEVLRYYRSRHDLALSATPKSMAPMEDRGYSGEFRRRYQKFNGLIWSYHWLQLVLYDVLITAPSAGAARTGVSAAISRFHGMLACAPGRLPAAMPMAAAVSPTFATRYPEVAAIFDNLHALHDVVSDILASPSVPPNGKRTALLAAAAEFRDDSTDAISLVEWRAMARSMGADLMGGVADAPPAAPSADCQ